MKTKLRSRPNGVLVAASFVFVAVPTACGTSPQGSTPGVSAGGVVSVVAAENQYGDVAAQIGGIYVRVVSVERNPSTDPHTYEVSPQVAREVSGAGLVIRNGVGYDAFMNKIESASPKAKRKTIDVQHLLRLRSSTPNPHLWYDPKTMPAVAQAVAADLSDLSAGHSSYFQSNLTRFDDSLQPWLQAIARFRAEYGGTPAATTEPVADYLLQAMGLDNLTPFRFQADIMNGTEPPPQDIALENTFFSKHKVKVFVYNSQVVDVLTRTIRGDAQKAGVPVVGVDETMPTPGYHYQSWMLAETDALQAAVVSGTSTFHL
jgi:zinc/manganese transport system substrate-binding protein